MSDEKNNGKITVDIQKFQKVLDIINEQQSSKTLIDNFKSQPLLPIEFDIMVGNRPTDFISETEKMKDIPESNDFKDKLSHFVGEKDKNAINLKQTSTNPEEDESIMLQNNRKKCSNNDYRSTVELYKPSSFKK